MSDARPTIARAIEVFARGFAFTRSFTHPYIPEQVGPVWVVRDGPRTRKSAYRKEEWIANGVPPAEVDRVARRNTRGRFAICAICGAGENEPALRAAYKNLGYRLQTTEPLMVHDFKRVPTFDRAKDLPVQIERVLTQDLANRVNAAAGRTQIQPEHLRKDAPLREYAALDKTGEPVGWVRSITVTCIDGATRTWCASMFVKPEHRRRGIGRALLSRMLRDDRAAGSTADVLLASHTGALLYPVVGYEQIGTLLLYTPRRT